MMKKCLKGESDEKRKDGPKHGQHFAWQRKYGKTKKQSSIQGGKRMEFFLVALGGAVGALGRYAISLIPSKTTFPFLTFITNIIGAILIGFVVGMVSARDDISQDSVLFWKTGVCGGFTTFSTFSLEAYSLFENKLYIQGGLYVVLSVICCILGVLCGKKLTLLLR